RSGLLTGLKRDAYGMYLIHYGFVVWLQYALLPGGMNAILKAAIVFTGTLALSWGVSAALRQIPVFALVLGAGRSIPKERSVSEPMPQHAALATRQPARR